MLWCIVQQQIWGLPITKAHCICNIDWPIMCLWYAIICDLNIAIEYIARHFFHSKEIFMQLSHIHYVHIYTHNNIIYIIYAHIHNNTHTHTHKYTCIITYLCFMDNHWLYCHFLFFMINISSIISPIETMYLSTNSNTPWSITLLLNCFNVISFTCSWILIWL